ncbi:MAG: SulP family inorganic anion transporter [Lachnospiraceae bacterium]|nr:SulP family inorganic anion transporter [Lachnospiraceae bacterium]
MEKLKPKLFSVMKDYTKEQLVKDIVAGIIVAIIALPLSIALAIASGVTPTMGIYTAIIAGFLVAFLGGSRVQIAGPTAAFATIVAGIVAKDGTEGLMIATILAGILLVLMGIFRFGGLLKYIPYTITTGFTAGIAVTLFIGQVKDFCGLKYPEGTPTIETVEKLEAIGKNISTINFQAVIVGIVCLAILILWPKVSKKIPGSLIAVIVSALLVKFMGLNVNTIGSLYPDLSNKLPSFTVTKDLFSFAMIRSQFSNAFTIAILAGIESLLSAVVADSMIQSKHRSNMELVAQGVANIGSACFGGIPATGAIARTAANIKNGGRTPIAGMVHSVTLVLVLVFLMPYAKLIPMPCIAAILFQVAYNMCGYKNFIKLCKTAAKSDVAVLVLTFVLTVVFDLVVAIEFGLIAAAFLFMKRMSEVTHVEGWKYIEDEDNDDDRTSLKKVPQDTLVYEFSGPMFFAAADNILKLPMDNKYNFLILRMRGVDALDATAMHNFETIYEECRKNHIQLVFSHVNEQPMKIMEKSKFVDLVGREFFCDHIDDALALCESLEAFVLETNKKRKKNEQ